MIWKHRAATARRVAIAARNRSKIQKYGKLSELPSLCERPSISFRDHFSHLVPSISKYEDREREKERKRNNRHEFRIIQGVCVKKKSKKTVLGMRRFTLTSREYAYGSPGPFSFSHRLA